MQAEMNSFEMSKKRICL